MALIDLVFFCNTVYAKHRAPKSGKCHRHEDDLPPLESNLLPLPCQATLTLLTFDHPELNFFVITQGTHTHPPPRARPPRHVVALIEESMLANPNRTVSQVSFDTSMWEGKTSVSFHPSLANWDTFQRIISAAKLVNLPHGEAYEAVVNELHITTKDVAQSPSPYQAYLSDYVKVCANFGDGHRFIHRIFTQQKMCSLSG